jgi:DNA-3-methyladenine glycosylase
MRKKEIGNLTGHLNPLDKEFYLNTDVAQVAKSLLGKYLIRNLNGHTFIALISETEAYRGRDDKACHAYQYKRTHRTEVMFSQGGIAYVYLIYGMYSMLNVVTNVSDEPDAVLIRGVLPVQGFKEPVVAQKEDNEIIKKLNGPGKLCKTLKIDTGFNRHELSKKPLWISHLPDTPEPLIEVSTRIGIDYAEEDTLRPWRFILNNGKEFL